MPLSKGHYIFLGAVGFVGLYFFHPSSWHSSRYAQLKCVIDRHTGFAHMTRGMNMSTIQALRQAVSEKDIPVLVQMLNDRDRVSQMTAAQALARMGPPGRAALEQELEKMVPKYRPGDNYYKRQTIEEALSANP